MKYRKQNICYLEWTLKKKLFWLQIEFSWWHLPNFSEYGNWVTAENYLIWKKYSGMNVGELVVLLYNIRGKIRINIIKYVFNTDG